MRGRRQKRPGMSAKHTNWRGGAPFRRGYTRPGTVPRKCRHGAGEPSPGMQVKPYRGPYLTQEDKEFLDAAKRGSFK